MVFSNALIMINLMKCCIRRLAVALWSLHASRSTHTTVLLQLYPYTGGVAHTPATAQMRRRLRRNTAAAALYSTTISLQQPVVAFHVNQGWYNQKEKEKKNISRSLAS